MVQIKPGILSIFYAVASSNRVLDNDNDNYNYD